MKWRCPERSGSLRCMFAPGHKEDHGALVTINGTQGMFFWENEATFEELVAEVYPEAEIVQEVAPPIELRPRRNPDALPPSGNPNPVYAGRSDLAGRRPTRATLNNPYAVPGEGVHITWGMFGHEILPLPMQDEIEWRAA